MQLFLRLTNIIQNLFLSLHLTSPTEPRAKDKRRMSEG